MKNEIEHARLDDLCLDPLNPRLGRNNTGREVSQERVMQLMREWTLDELAISFLENGFWPQEALLVVREELYGYEQLIVVEGNRRLAALRYLRDAVHGNPASKKWADIAGAANEVPADLFDRIPYIQVDSRKEIEAFLGFRHVTGIKEWKPAEKAEYIARLIEDSNMSYREVMRKIGSKTETVRRNYIAYRVLRQMEEIEDIDASTVEERFSVLFLSLRTEGVQEYLGVNIQADPVEARLPVAGEKEENLRNFSTWLFGTTEREPLVADSRQIQKFSDVLLSAEALTYLARQTRPSLEMAYRHSGGQEREIAELIDSACDNVEEALSTAHLYAESDKVKQSMVRFAKGVGRLFDIFPGIRADHFK